MKYLIILSLFLTGCMSSDDFMPVVVSQLVDTNKQVKKNADLIAKHTEQTSPSSPIAVEAKLNAEGVVIQPKASGFDFLNETIMGLLMASGGLGGLLHAKKKISMAGNQHPDEFNNKT